MIYNVLKHLNINVMHESEYEKMGNKFLNKLSNIILKTVWLPSVGVTIFELFSIIIKWRTPPPSYY